jgi:transcriptional regulator with XRE-family HTH domain
MHSAGSRKLRLAQKIRAIRGQSVREFAEEFGFNKASLDSYSTGRVDPPTSKLIRIAQCLGIGLDELVFDEKPSPASGALLALVADPSYVPWEPITQEQFAEAIRQGLELPVP